MTMTVSYQKDDLSGNKPLSALNRDRWCGCESIYAHKRTQLKRRFCSRTIDDATNEYIDRHHMYEMLNYYVAKCHACSAMMNKTSPHHSNPWFLFFLSLVSVCIVFKTAAAFRYFNYASFQTID